MRSRRQKLATYALALVVAVAFYLLNPMALFGERYDYDAADMRAVVEGTWRLSLDGHVTTLAITQGGQADVHAARESLIRSAAACGSRTLIQSADACMADTTMPLHVVAVAADAPPVATRLEGTFMVASTKFHLGQLALTIGNAHVEADLWPDRTISDVEAYRSGKPGDRPKVSFERIAAAPVTLER